jgi:2-polyprenyl-6-methoxyphenol hydroxylase-like FAD-dependent oxidoreductase
MKNHPHIYDVINIGYGPVSEILALALAKQGRSVAIFERWEQRYPLPRAVCIDHEMYRMLSALGLGDELPNVSHDGPWYRWFNADWKELLAIDWSQESISGGAEVHFVHQPTLEQMFDDAVKSYSNVDINLGWEALEVTQKSDHAELVARHAKTGETKTFYARYIVGADGANSMVRDAIQSTREDLGFEADWLVIDVLPHEGVTLDIPTAAQYCNPIRPTTIVPAGIKDGRYFRRWEFMRLPHETSEELESEEVAWKLLEKWVKRDQATIVRHKVYKFRSLLADKWREGRLLIAGDAAHLMPPFMGQGMCAGLRDIWNLAWKLSLVLDGKSDDEILDTYQPERRPHVRNVIEMSMFLGKIICISDPKQAAERDEAFFTGKVPPPPPFPHLIDGFLRRGADGKIADPVGMLSPHGRVLMNLQEGRYDDIVGLGFKLIVRNSQTLEAIGVSERECLSKLGVTTVHIVESGTQLASAAQDLDRKFIPFMHEHNIEAMVIRPDFYVYGVTTESNGINQLINDLVQDLKKIGVKVV